MKKLLFLAVVLVATMFSAGAQSKIDYPHDDYDIMIDDCTYADGVVTLNVQMINYGLEGYLSVLSSESVATDDKGNVYDLYHGSPSETIEVTDTFSLFMAQEIKTMYRFQIKDVDPTATKFAKLSVVMLSPGLSLSAENPLVLYDLEWTK